MRPSRRIAAALLATCAFVLIAVTQAQAAYKNPIGGSSNSSSPVCYSHWQSVGPFAVDPGTDLAGIGAVGNIFHSASNGEAFVGTAHGGVWRGSASYAVTFEGVHWEAVTDHMPCSGVSALAGSTSDTAVVAVGCGLDSSAGGRHGEPMGVMITLDRGNTWTMTGFPRGYDVSAIVVTGGTINPADPVRLVVAARAAVVVRSGSADTTANPYDVDNAQGGIWHSLDGGVTFTRVFTGSVSDIVSADGITMYATALVARDATNGWPASLLQSSDSGATWPPVAPAFSSQLDTLCNTTGLQPSLVNARVMLPPDGSVTVGFVVDADVSGQACYAFGSFTGAAWTEFTAPPTGPLSLSTSGGHHLAMTTVTEVPGPLLVAGSSRAVYAFDLAASQWTLLSTLPGEASTASATKTGTAPGPGATSFGCILESDAQNVALFNLRLTTSSGIYERNIGYDQEASAFVFGDYDWKAQSSDLAIAEAYQAAVDPVSGAIAIGAHNNGVMISQLSDTEKTNGAWSAMLRTDVASVGLDSSASPARFYASASYLSELFKVAVNGSAGGKESFTQPFPAVGGSTPCSLGSSSCFAPQTFLAVNSVSTGKVLLCTVERCYTASFGPTSQSLVPLELAISPSGSLRSYVYGGRRNGVNNEHVVFAVGRQGVWARDVNTCATDSCVKRYAGTSCTGECTLSSSFNTNPPWFNAITRAQPAQHPEDYHVNLVIDDAGHCWLTTDFGQTWKDLNTNSNLLAVTNHTSVDTFHTGAAIFVDTLVADVYPLIIATPNGAFVSFDVPTAPFFTFVRLGAHWARAAPSGLTYSPTTDTLTLASFGRGVWQLQAASLVLAQAARNESTTTLNSNCTVPLYPNVPGMFGYTTGPTPEPIGFPDPIVPAPSSSSTGAAVPSTSSSTGAAPSSSTGAGSSSTGGASPSTGAASSSTGTASSTGATSSTGGNASSTGATASSASSSTATDTSSTGDQPGVDSSSTGEPVPSDDSSSGVESSTGAADSTAEPMPEESSSGGSEEDSSTGEDQPTDDSSTGSDPEPVPESSTAEPTPESSTGEPEPEPSDDPNLQVQFRMSYSLDALPDGMDKRAFSDAVQNSLNRLLGVVDRVWVVSVVPGSVVVTVAIYPRSIDTDHAPSDRLQGDLIGLINTAGSALYQDPLMDKAEIGSAQVHVPDTPDESSSSSSSTGGVAPPPRDDGSRLPQAGSNDRGSDLGIGIGIGIGLLVLISLGCVGLHIKAKREYEARKNALIDSTAEMI